ncbi:immunoglobulin superfamily member 3-like [Polyodon spathula]|uniref:immunoglobulin superfamily member 3-like n=1 Tax=Polyodon spathula TaxID=7913 RepID=UPI001B7EEA7E|nr:immunoglobulin superfamily member 3-like [Polyodon spathula]
MAQFNMNHQRASLLCFLTFLLLWDYSASQRTVQIQQGQLYRAKGYPVTIACNVSGYETNTQQDFEFSFFSPDNPQQEINIISTKNTNFAYAKYRGRVGQKDIFIERRSRDKVLLHIRKLVDDDTGEYECHTPNTDLKYFGTYNDKMSLTVIEDTLEATLVKETLNKFEGDPLQLKCEVSKQTLQHTHISVTWYLNKTEDLRLPIISLMRDFLLNPGSEYRVRYEAGHIGLDKIGETTYRLSISQLQQSDQGHIYCEASEWIQDPDRSWYQIASKTTATTTVNVQGVGKDFNTQIVTNQGPLIEGDTLEIRCMVEAQNIPDRYFSVVWLRNNEEMASFGPTGVPDIGDNYRARESNRQLKVVKKSNSDYLFIVYRVSKEDSGSYQCRVTEMEKGSGENFIGKTPKFSVEVVLDIRPLRSLLTADLKSRTINVRDNNSIILQCKVKGPKVPLSITWTFMAKDSQTENIVVIHYDGKITWGEKTSNFKFKTIVEKTESDSNLKITRASLTEMGKYQCVAEAWINEVQLASVSSNQLEVIVSKPVSKLSISNEPLTIKSKVNANVEIECKIKASTYEDSQFEVSWYANKYDKDVGNKTILITDRNNILMPGELMNSHQMKNKYQSKRCSKSSYKLIILQTDLADSGKYYCVVEEWLQDANNIWYSMDKKSVEIEVDIVSIENKLQVLKTNTTMIVHENKEFKVNCTFSNEVQSTSQFSVIWYYQNSSYAKKTLLKVKHNSVFEFLGGDKELMKRIQFYSPSVGTYTLVIQKADVGDSGIYFCQVDEWIINSKNQLDFQSSDVSGFTNVEIHHPEKKLHVHKRNVSISLVEKQGSFKLNCSIDSISSRESTFEVTWWKRTEQGENQAIFISQRNSTFRFLNGTKSSLLFERPTAELYTLTVQRAVVMDSGSYYCRVKELLLSPRNQWHEIATDTSGTSTVDIKQEEHSVFSTVCASQSLLSFVFIYPFIVIVLLIMVILYLYYKLWKAGGTHKSCKENGPSLWSERGPLKSLNEIDAQDEIPNGGDVEMNSDAVLYI